MKLDHSNKVLDDAKKAVGPLDKPNEETSEKKVVENVPEGKK